MANITAELTAFKNAVYGEEVRDSMVSAIRKINDQVERVSSIASANKLWGYIWKSNPIQVKRDSNATIVTIDSSANIVTATGTITSNWTGDIAFTTTNWLSYDVDSDTFFAGQAGTAGHTIVVLGYVSHTGKTVLINGHYKYEDQTAAGRGTGMILAKGFVTYKRTDAGCIFTLPVCNVATPDGAFANVPEKTFELTGVAWISYDATANEFVDALSIAGHKLYNIGVIYPAYYERCYINGSAITIAKSIAFVGDSITAGSGTSITYHEYLSRLYGWNCYNWSYGGSGYARSYDSTGGLLANGVEGRGEAITTLNRYTPNYFMKTIEKIPKDIDGMVIFGGTNDYGHSDSIPFAQFKSAVANTIDYVQTNFPKIPLVVMTPISRNGCNTPNAEGKTLKDYADAIIDVCREKGVPYVDTFAMSGLNANNEANANYYFTRDDTGASDGLHPNHFAHRRIMRALESDLKEALYYMENMQV